MSKINSDALLFIKQKLDKAPLFNLIDVKDIRESDFMTHEIVKQNLTPSCSLSPFHIYPYAA